MLLSGFGNLNHQADEAFFGPWLVAAMTILIWCDRKKVKADSWHYDMDIKYEMILLAKLGHARLIHLACKPPSELCSFPRKHTIE